MKYMPIMNTPFAVQFSLLSEKQAGINCGGQTLDQLAARGGLSLNEAACIAAEVKFVKMNDTECWRTLMVAAVIKKGLR